MSKALNWWYFKWREFSRGWGKQCKRRSRQRRRKCINNRARWARVEKIRNIFLLIDIHNPRDKMSLLWKIMYQNHKDVIPNLIVLAELALILPIHTADCEQGFSNQNLIKSKSRNSMGDAALNHLILLSIKGRPLEELDFIESLSVWKAQKDRRIFHKV